MNLLDLIFPKYCVSCGRIGGYVCSSCLKTIQPVVISETICPMCGRPAMGGKTHPFCRNKYALDGLVSFFHYRGVIKNAIKSIKYQFISDVTKKICQLSFQSQPLLERYPFFQSAICLPIPLHPSRHRFRGFNQAELFGKELAQYYHLTYKNAMIRRSKISLPQVETKNRRERMKNMKDMFSLVENVSIPSQILLIDDVFTTGATMREAGRVLKQAGAEKVWGVTIAR